MGNRNRREFLLGAGLTAANLAAIPLLFADSRKTDPKSAALKSDPLLANSSSSTSAGMNESDPGKTPMRGKLRGLMVDAGRVPEPLEYYRRVIEFCADWELNVLQFRLADDQGSALRFNSVPDLVTHGNAFTPEQLKSLAEFARSHGVDLIPELESFGHTGFVTRSPTYAHLLDREAQGDSEFTGMIPVHPESLQLFDKLYREIASICPSIYLHGGCDEVNWGGSMLSRKALQTKTRAQIWAEYLNALNGISERLGKQFIVWGDVVLRKEPEILSLLKKNIVIMDWSYYDNSSASIRESFLKVRANGSRGIGAPALSCYKWGPRVGVEQLRNIDAVADAYLGTNDDDSLGVILTNWIPSRYVQNSIWDGFAYAAVAFNKGTATAQTSGFRRFVEKHYRASWNEQWSEAFQIIYESAPGVRERETESGMGLSLRIPWSNEEQLATLLRDISPRANPFTRLCSLLVELEPLVLKNLADFRAFALCAEYLEKTYWRDTVVVEQAGKLADRETAELLIQNIAERDRALAEALSKDWDKGRFPDSAAKLEPVFGLAPKDQLLLQWQRAAAYSADLASHPDHFHQLLQRVNRG
jgi:Glycosyl hydrolase family 20, catalytic domain